MAYFIINEFTDLNFLSPLIIYYENKSLDYKIIMLFENLKKPTKVGFKKSKKERSKQNIAKKLPFEKTIGKAKKSRRFIDSYIRNKNVKPLKALYNDKCQIVECNFTLEYVNRKKEKAFYSHLHLSINSPEKYDCLMSKSSCRV